MSQEHHFTLYTHKLGPNGWKVAIVLEELGLEYRSLYLDVKAGEHKGPEHTKFNPNGRIPTLIDHKNDDFVIWESDAIITYLVEKYDPEGKISATSFEEKMQQLQWLFFQASGQGPYFGQAAVFIMSHPEKIPSAIERYQKEILRVLGVLESVLSKREWLVGGKCTVADLSFIPCVAPLFTYSAHCVLTCCGARHMWNALVLDGTIANGYSPAQFEADFPAVYKWHHVMTNRPTVKKIYAIRETFKV